MDKKPLISIIVPVYNAEKYLSKCLDSILSQTYKNLEIIIINDGSTDNSPDICAKYALKDTRIKLINQENKGAGAARNTGISNALGAYFTFIDADDYIDADLVMELTNAIEANVDFVMCGMNIGNKKITAQDAIVTGHKQTVKYILKSLLSKNLLYGPVCKLFLKQIIIDNNILFAPNVKYAEDTIFVLEYLKFVNTLKNVAKPMYTYNYLPAGLASNNNTNLLFRAQRVDMLKKFLYGNCTFGNFILYIAIRIRWCLSLLKSYVKKGLKSA
ncbi:glycosyltransferase involved in cell wall biosynthesis [Elusimicrobium posterum]|uniref:glycosyltransferase family 2 protein n=1 Tax=Elusimicrobium posterum TaxID=3116653 RepID=UPI003C73A195